MLKVRLTPAADADLEAIFAYTLERYGLSQARNYWTGLHKAFKMLVTHPLLGSDQSDIRPDIRRLVHEAHVIYYQVGREEIIVARILGPGQDPLEEL